MRMDSRLCVACVAQTVVLGIQGAAIAGGQTRVARTPALLSATMPPTAHATEAVTLREPHFNTLPPPSTPPLQDFPTLIFERPLQRGKRMRSAFVLRELGDTTRTRVPGSSTINTVMDENDLAVVGGIQLKF